MKKLFLIITITLIVSGCSLLSTNTRETNNNQPSNIQGSDNQNTNVTPINANNLNQNSNTACSGPEFHKDGLYLCDKKIGSLPYNVKDLNRGDGQNADLIVFADGDVIKTINNKAPYAQQTIAKNINLESDGSLGPCFYYNGLYSCDIQAGGPGDFNQVFAFDSKDNRFIFAVYKVWPGKPTEMKLSSSFSEGQFVSSIDMQCPPTDGLAVCTYDQATSLDININGKSYDKQDYLDNKDNIGDFIGCLGYFDFNAIALGRHIKNSEGDLYPSINSVANNFASKRINCLDYNSNGEQIGIKGYIDLTQNKFIIVK